MIKILFICHLSIDSGFLGIEKTVSLIVNAAGGEVEHE